MPGAVVEVPTSLGTARAYVRRGSGHGGRLLLGHGAGGGVAAADLIAVAGAAHARGWAVALVEQPWRVAGRRVAVPPARLDEAWLQVVPVLLDGELADGELADGELGGGGGLVLGGRSAGARVACRTSAELGATGVLALAFPLHPPGRPGRSRAHELDVDAPLLVVQGRSDPFGSPDAVVASAAAGTRVVGVDGDHSLKRDLPALVEAVGAWLPAMRS